MLTLHFELWSAAFAHKFFAFSMLLRCPPCLGFETVICALLEPKSGNAPHIWKRSRELEKIEIQNGRKSKKERKKRKNDENLF